jgi:hypothetical protein
VREAGVGTKRNGMAHWAFPELGVDRHYLGVPTTAALDPERTRAVYHGAPGASPFFSTQAEGHDVLNVCRNVDPVRQPALIFKEGLLFGFLHIRGILVNKDIDSLNDFHS